MPLPELRGQRAKIASRPMPLERSHQSSSRVGAEIVEGVRWQDGAVKGSRIGNSVRQPELVCDAIDLPDTVPAILGLAQVEAVEMRECDDGFCLSVAVL